eukprot:CAMPEP_0196586296 /NCGR_PEP_ID=MMETSP1081-20130531/53788_1 /TAXON_ID=36882 /ORGANISM="Pyramimonas amylifera, Strain CCMP720" /LENGTH=66 /DNA_ID=CAMNT_0041908129 /DNA_START=184 /DNA_END=381 /DNA_ORIENTATION=+
MTSAPPTIVTGFAAPRLLDCCASKAAARRLEYEKEEAEAEAGFEECLRAEDLDDDEVLPGRLTEVW